MATPYQSAGGTIGGLLRQIQEDKNMSPLATPPQTQPGSAIRDLIQEPVFQSESPESARVFAQRPESAPSVDGAVADINPPTPTEPAANQVVGAAEPPAPVVQDAAVPDVATFNGAPSPRPQMNPLPQAPAAPATPAPRATQPTVLGLGTKITSAPAKAAPVQAPRPSPTPAPTANAATIGGRVAQGLGALPGLLRLGQAIYTPIAASTKSLEKGLSNFFSPRVRA